MPYIIGLGTVLLFLAIIMIAVRKLPVALKKMIRGESLIAGLLAIVIVVNLICFGPMSTMLTLIVSSGGNLSEETSEAAIDLCTEIAEEGYVLLKNENNTLPLNGTSKLNVFGWASTNPVYAGTGSGALSDVYPTVSLLDGLTSAGFELNTELSDFYTAYRDGRPDINESFPDWTLPEPSVDTYTQEMMNNATAFSDTALVIISRVSGEGIDLPNDMTSYFDGSRNTSEDAYLDNFMYPKGYYINNDATYTALDFDVSDHYMKLSNSEENMVKMVCENFSNVIVIYNGANAFELGWVDQYSEIKGVLWCAGAGQSGFTALGEILMGAVNPSAKTTDLFVYDLTTTPTYKNFGNFIYDNMSEYDNGYYYYEYLIRYTQPAFVNYVEGIYVGYRFYETAAEEGFLDYDALVQYPFGYGLSYTDFTKEMGEMTVEDEVISFDVTVTNTGDAAGKDVVEIYYNPPYYNNGIEKASVNLIAFDKTEILKPGESEVITISFNVEDMASYDEKDVRGYMLEHGDYIISVNSDSHTILDSRIYTVDDDIIYNVENPRSTDNIAATNQFDQADGGLTYLSRTDSFANYDEAVKAPKSLTMPEDMKTQYLCNATYDPAAQDDPDAEMPVIGAKNGVVLADLRGKDYDDPLWDRLLDQLTVSDMDSLISLTGYQTQVIDSVGKAATVECDGPVAVNNSFTGEATIGFTPAVVIANTWNEELAFMFGDSMGLMSREMGVNGWYAPAINMHRSAFGGRNFEYFSEDGLLAGKMAAQIAAGSANQGVYAFIKHFALNDQETNRYYQLCTYSTEQAIREVYLKPFEIAIKEGEVTAVMAGLNYIGLEAAGSHNGLLNVVLRDEWGFQGMVITDYFVMAGYQNADQQIRNGCDGCLIAYDVAEAHVKVTSASGVQAMRQASRNIMYTVVNSWAYENGSGAAILIWMKIVYAVDVVAILTVILLEMLIFRNYRKRNSTDSALISKD